MTAELSKAPTRPERCPECGYDTHNRRIPPPPSLFHWRITAPALVVLAALLALAWMFLRNWQTSTTGSGTAQALVIEPSFTLDDIGRIADSRQMNSGLAATLQRALAEQASALARYPGDPVLTTGFVEGRGMRRDTLMYGWPTGWVTRISYSLYDDAVARTGPRPMRTWTPQDNTGGVILPNEPVAANSSLDDSGLVMPRPRWSWGTYGGGYLAYRPTPEETGGTAYWLDINTYGVVAVVGLIVLGWALLRIAIWAINVVRDRSKPRLRSGLVSLFGALAVAAVIAWMTIETCQRTDTFIAPRRTGTFVRTGATGGYYAQRGMEHSSLRASALPSLAASPDGDRVAAQAILGALKDQPAPAHYLAIALNAESIMHNGSGRFWRAVPVLSWHSTQYIRRSDIGSPDLMANPPGVRWDFQNAYLRRTVSSGDPAQAESGFSINLGSVGLIVLGTWVLWLLARLICRGITQLIMRCRRRRNQCIACGHALGPPVAA